MPSRIETLAANIEAQFGAQLKAVSSIAGELTYEVSAADLIAVCTRLRDDTAFKFEQLMDLAGVDYLIYGQAEWNSQAATRTGFSRGVTRSGEGEMLPDLVAHETNRRFAVVYHLLSISNNVRMRLRVFCDNADAPMLDSMVGVWASANWFEREAFDMFGILFKDHPDLRRILTDYGFIGHPFRKDFPLMGNVEVLYDAAKGRVVYQPVSIEPRTLVPRVIRDDNRYDAALTGSAKS
jgi:NADH-quinone oxidoreductase subunit C